MLADTPTVSISSRERTAWFVLAILLLFSIAAPLNQAKVPPIMPILMEAFHLSVGRAGLLMSVFAVTGLVLALPAGLIFQKLGYRITSLIAGGSIALGATLGALSLDMSSMLVSRVIEGIGTSFMAVLAPASGREVLEPGGGPGRRSGGRKLRGGIRHRCLGPHHSG